MAELRNPTYFVVHVLLDEAIVCGWDDVIANTRDRLCHYCNLRLTVFRPKDELLGCFVHIFQFGNLNTTASGCGAVFTVPK